MATPIVICDDSSFARKQIARALPTGWDVTVTLAANGREALAAIEAGRGDILFLDLTMPEMDGFQVLEAIRARDLPTLPIVVSGDIQPESRTRVLALGAVAFIKKPIDATELLPVLESYGLLGLLTAPPVTSQSALEQHDFRDLCQELANVAMGRAADLLARAVSQRIELSIPRVRFAEPADLSTLLVAAVSTGDLLLCQGFAGGGLAGETLLLVERNRLAEVVALTGSEAGGDGFGATFDLINILFGAFLKGLAEQLDLQFSQGRPTLVKGGSAHFPGLAEGGSALLVIEVSYTVGENLRCEQLLLLTSRAVARLRQQFGFSEEG